MLTIAISQPNYTASTSGTVLSSLLIGAHDKTSAQLSSWLLLKP